MMGALIGGALIGLVAGIITHTDDRRGCLGNIIIGMLGSWLGGILFNNWGPMFLGYSFIPATLGAIILIALFSRRN